MIRSSINGESTLEPWFKTTPIDWFGATHCLWALQIELRESFSVRPIFQSRITSDFRKIKNFWKRARVGIVHSVLFISHGPCSNGKGRLPHCHNETQRHSLWNAVPGHWTARILPFKYTGLGATSRTAYRYVQILCFLPFFRFLLMRKQKKRDLQPLSSTAR